MTFLAIVLMAALMALTGCSKDNRITDDDLWMAEQPVRHGEMKVTLASWQGNAPPLGAPAPEYELLVPAIQKKYCASTELTDMNTKVPVCRGWEFTYTCADKSNILLHAEDGKAWCLKVPNGK